MKLLNIIKIYANKYIVATILFFLNFFVLAFCNLSYAQALQGTIIDQPTRPAGVSVDLNGNLFVISDATYTTLLTRYGIDGTKQYVTLGGIDPTTFTTARLGLDPKNGMIYLLSPTGQIYAVDPQTMAVQLLLDFRVPAFGDVAEDSYEIMTQRFYRFPFIQPYYGDIAVYRINEKLFDIFVSGRTRLSPPSFTNPPLVGPVYFVLRLRVDENARIYTQKVVAWGKAGTSPGIGGTSITDGYPNAAGVAVNSDGTVLTALPALVGFTGLTYMALVSFRYDFPESRTQTNLLPHYLFLDNQGKPRDFSADGMTSGPDGRFYFATTAVGSSECGVGGSGSLVVVSRDLSSFLCIPSNIILNKAFDVSVNSQNAIFLTNYYPSLLIRFNAVSPINFTLITVKSGSGSGTITSAPAGINCGGDCSESYPTNTAVILTATPASGSTFAGWSGACSGTGSCAVTMGVDRSVTATFNAASTADQTLVTQYYQSILGRAPDSGGLAYWQGEIVRLQGLGVDVQEAFRVMAGWFFTSAEYLGKNTSDGQYVTDLYRTFFQRDPDGGGLGFWTGQLAAGMPRAVVLYSFLFSAEFGSYMQGLLGNTASRGEVYAVVDFYRGFLNRLPDPDGFSYWLNRFRAAQCQGASAVNAEVESISGQFAASGEYANRKRSNRDYVGDLYYAFLRRGGELTGFDFWVSQLDNGLKTREQLRQEFLKSPEFQSRVQQIVSQGCLR